MAFHVLPHKAGAGACVSIPLLPPAFLAHKAAYVPPKAPIVAYKAYAEKCAKGGICALPFECWAARFH